MDTYFKTDNLAVGYNGNILIQNININIEKGKILTLIGPNGAGKSTILKSVTKQISKIKGTIYIGNSEISKWPQKDMAKNVSVVLTDKIKPELMSTFEVVALGRYPYTNMIGKLTKEDTEIVEDSLRKVNALKLRDNDFSKLSDGQKQRVILARAICQKPQVIVLDEPTAYLDIKHKIEVLDILQKMAREENITVIMSLHEIDLAMKISDYLICVKGNSIKTFTSPKELTDNKIIENIYKIEKGSYNLNFGSIELAKPTGEPKVFIVGGCGFGIPHYRDMQKKNIPFATGILFENDIDYHIAKDLSDHIVVCPAFEPITANDFTKAKEILLKCEKVIDAGTPAGTFNGCNRQLLEFAAERNIPVISSL